jgi:exopolysaccharide biosynthesis polyprenyl glycosylphosphotransferase
MIELKPIALLPMKRLFDIVFSTLCLVLLSPIFLLLFFIIPINSPGAAIYKQERVGMGGQTFYIYKFRSMVDQAEKETGPVLALNKDPRVTFIGKFLRRTRMDEWPQLWNILKGEMSVVGPRPERPYFVDTYEATIPNYRIRHIVRPGITGLAQVKGSYSTPTETKLSYDLQYIYSYSFFLDIKIVCSTFKVIMQQERAEGIKSSEDRAVEKSFYT